MADSPAECQKLVLVELHVSQASAAGISRCLGRDESSECLTYDLVHSWRSRGDKMLLESASPNCTRTMRSLRTSSTKELQNHKNYRGSGGRRRRLRQEPEPCVVRVHDPAQRFATNAEVRVLEAVLREVLLVRAHASELRELVQVVH